MYHPDYQDISKRFRHRKVWDDHTPIEFPDELADLFFLSFRSSGGRYLLGHTSYRCEEHGIDFPGETTLHSPTDHLINQNLEFRYPLVRDHAAAGAPRKHRRGIILFHGLNERSFSKYIPWAYHLWAALRAPVILFPLSFHINRVNPRWMFGQQQNYEQRLAIAGNENVHRFNAVMSDRLGAHPDRFFWGAIQSYWDVVDLVRTVRAGTHPHFTEDAVFDLFGFSAGGFVSLALMLENTEGLFDESRAVLFSTCAAVRDMSLSSPLIVDQHAEIALMQLYAKSPQKFSTTRQLHWLHEHSEGKWLNGFCGLRPDRSLLDGRLKEIAPRLFGIANSNDQVIPAGGMYNALQGIRRDIPVRIEELELGIHENPFASRNYETIDRSIITDFLNVEIYGGQFEKFIELSVGHLGKG